jgi:hypothetical protein
MTRLKYLNVAGNKNITDEGLENKKQIEYLDISHNEKVTSVSINRLHAIVITDNPNLLGVEYQLKQAKVNKLF